MKKIYFSVLCGLFLTFMMPLSAKYHSQTGQDKYLNDNFFHGMRNGVFVDIGAYDGKFISNTYYYEQELGWTGICIEPMPRAFKQLKANRKCKVLNCLVGSENGTATFFEIDAEKFPDLAMLSGEIQFFNEDQKAELERVAAHYQGACTIRELPVKKLNNILEKNKIYRIDYLSIDIEGGELGVLSALDFERFHIHLMSVENNKREAFPDIQIFLESKGFRFVTRLEQDEIYENTNF